jgi:hypothetical protein
MDGLTIGIIVLVVAAIAFYIYQRSRPAPRGTYDDPKVHSSGSIGGGPKAYDSPEVNSSGSIGGGAKAYDAPEVKSTGSLDGQSTAARKVRTHDNPDDSTEDEAVEESTYNDRSVKSSGSFGKS